MNGTQFSGKLVGLLGSATEGLCGWLSDALPKFDQVWWSSRVLSSLSYQQRDRVERKGINSLHQLDLAALLRVMDRNWYELSDKFNLTNQDRNYVKEMQTIRNRWAHLDVHGVDADDMYRDVDTVYRFLKIVQASEASIEEANQLKKELLNVDASFQPRSSESDVDEPSEHNEAGSTRPPFETADDLQPGTLVSLVSDPLKTGAVLSVEGSDPSSRCRVFMDGKPQPFYLSQLKVVAQEENQDMVRLQELHGLLTALQIRHPSQSTLYSLNAARIDFVPYQFRPALKIIRSDQPRLLIADSVGVGKTIEAGLILRELQARNNIESVLIICPKPLVAERKWELEMKRFDEQFSSLDGKGLRFCIHECDLEGEWPENHAKAIVPYSLLQDEALLHGKKNGRRNHLGLLDLDPPPKFDLVIVDEAHHIRNSNTYAHQAVSFFCEHAEAVVFLTATPVQMGNRDLFTLLNVLRPDLVIDPETFEHMAEPNLFINQAVNQARGGGEEWQKLAEEALRQAAATAWGRSLLKENPAFKEVLQRLESSELDREGRVGLIPQIEEFHSFSRLINRTRRRDIDTFCIRKPETVSIPFTAAQQQLHDDLLEFQARALEAVHGGQHVKFMMTTIRRQAASCVFGLAPFITDILQRRLTELEWLETSGEEGEPSELFQSLENEALEIVAQAEALPPEDPKYDALLHIVKEKNELPNNKVMIFSTFRHTLAYLESKLRLNGIRIGLVHGGVKDEERLILRERFELPKEDPLAIDVMLFSEVGCEGLDYQFCDMMINYDLPWNPMRIEQRIGRIDRRGQKNEAVAIYNMITPGTVDADVYDRCLLRIGIFESSIGECEEILGEITKEIRDIAENLELTEAQRQKKLEQLADNEIREIQEQEKLEEKAHELFGLQVPASEVRDSESYWLTPASIQRFVEQYLSQRLGKGEYILGDKPLKSLRLSKEARIKLRADFQGLEKSKSLMFRTWEKWLKGDEPHCVITFDSACAADHREALFIMPLHPLVLQAAHALDGLEPVYTAFRIQEAGLEPGHYPFSIYAWELKGLRPELKLIPVCANEAVRQNFFDHLEAGAEIDPSEYLISEEDKDRLDRVHHGLWEGEKAIHQSKTEEMVRFRMESLEISHAGRCNVISEQIEMASNEKIRKMKQAQFNNIQMEYDRKLAELKAAQSAADIHARPVVFGTLMVER